MVATCSLKGDAVTFLTALQTPLPSKSLTVRVLSRRIAALEGELEVWDLTNDKILKTYPLEFLEVDR